MMTHLHDRIRRNASGLRLALRLVLLSIATASPLSAVASGPAAHGGAIVTIFPGPEPFNVVADAKGNLFFSLYNAKASVTIKEIVATSGIITPNSPVVDVASVPDPSGLAMAPNGDLLALHQGANGTPSSLYRVAATNGTIAPNSTGVLVNTFPGLPIGIAVDRNGNVYVANQGTIYEVVASGGAVSSASAVNTLFTSFKAILGLAFAPNGDLAVTDTGTASLDVIRATGGTISAISSVVTIDSNLADVSSVAVDRQGNIYTGDPDNNAVHEFLAVNGLVGPGAAERTTSVPECNGEGVQGLLVDGDGNLYVASNGSGLFEVQGPVQRVLPVAVGSTGTAQRIYFTFDSSDLAAIFTINESGDTAEDLDFVRSPTQPSNACEGNKTYAQGDVCAVDVIFTPKAPGMRPAAIQILNYTNQVIGTAFIGGVGTGPLPQLVPVGVQVFAGGAPSSSTTGVPGPASSMAFYSTAATRVDASGNLYLALNGQDCTIVRIDAKTNYATLVAGKTGVACGDSGDGGPATAATLGTLNGMALDAAGNIFVSTSYVIRRIDAVTGVITRFAGNGNYNDNGSRGDGGPALQATINPRALLVDPGGSVYVSDFGNGFGGGMELRRIDAVTGIINAVMGDPGTGYAVVPPALALAFNNEGNLYTEVSNTNILTLVNLQTSAITVFPRGTSNNDGIPFSQYNFGSSDLAVDAADDLYGLGSYMTAQLGVQFAEQCAVRLEQVNQIVRRVGCVKNYAGTTLALDAQGNFYFDDFAPNGGVAIYKSFPVTPTLNFPSTTWTGYADTSDNPQTQVIANIGNEPLLFSNPASAADPTVSPQWSPDSGTTTCPTSSNTSLAAGQECTLGVDFAPSGSGTQTGTVAFIDNALNVPGSTQTINLTGSGQAFTASPQSITFAATPVGGSSATATVTLTNTALLYNVNVNAEVLSDTTDFKETDNCLGVVSASSSCTLTFTFNPKSAGSLTSTFKVSANSYKSGVYTDLSKTITLNGAATGGLSLSPPSISFPSTAVGSSSTAMTATLGNAGSSAVYLTKGSLTDATDFTQSDNCGGIVVAGGSCTVTFTFTPKSAVSLSSTYSIADLNNQSSPLTVALSGTGTAPYGLTIAPASITFPATAVGATSSAMTATLTLNGGSTRVNLISGALTDATDFTQSDNCGGSITPNGSCTITFLFTPKSVGTLSSTYSIGLQNGTPVTVSLTGSGTGTPSATLTPSSSNFGSVTAGTSTAATVFTLTNTGNIPLNILSVTLTGANASSFNISANTCGSSLAAGAACTASAVFAPTAAGTFTASLTVVDNAGTQVSTLTGTATSPIPPDFTISATPTTQSAYHGGSVSYTVQLASLLSSNPFTNPVVLSVTGLPAGATASFTPASVTPGTGQPTSQLTIGIPTLSSMDMRIGATGLHLAVLSLGSIIFLLPRWKHKRGRGLTRLLPLLSLVFTSTAIGAICGCGTGNGFATPTATYTLTITGTGNSSAHSTTVTLIVK